MRPQIFSKSQTGRAPGRCFPLQDLTLLLALLLGQPLGFGAVTTAVDLPKDVQVVWTLEKAYRETTPTRERISLNGLWQWLPAYANAKSVPADSWGYFKVPGCWPGISDYMQKDCQTVYAHPNWSDRKLGEVTAAWYQREIVVPKEWATRRVSVSMDNLNSYASVYLDGRLVGEARFPGGEVDITSAVREPGQHKLALLVIALPLKAVMLSYTDSAAAREQKGAVARRGLCGDVFLVSTPQGPRLADLRVETSVRKKELRLNALLKSVALDGKYRLQARVFEGRNPVKEFASPEFRGSEINQGHFEFSQAWLPDKLWDTHTPQNQYQVEVTLLDAAGKALDTSWRIRFGFRELWIDGRDFYLNGSRIFLSAVPLDNAQVSAASATYDAARESLERLKTFGINFVYTHNYGCEPGAHLGFEEILRAADDAGMLVSFSQPHFSHYDWKEADADQRNGYAGHAAYYVGLAQNHPSVVMYSMSHNATGYDEDMNPALIDGIHDARDSWALKNAALATRAQKIVSRLDPSRIVYHHASGNLGPMHTINFYPNFAPIQELSDWFEHWSTEGVKPVFTCEYGAPFTWDWTLYRGWYRGQREFGSAAVPWEFCLAEWNAQFVGDPAFAISDAEKRNLRWEAEQFRADKVWHRWDYPVEVGSDRLEERYPIFARYITDNWRAFRTWEVSAVSPWEWEHFWKLREGVARTRENLKTDWQNLQRPGFSPDYLDERYERMDMAYQRSDWVPTAAARALIANNGPILAYLAGKPGAFTSKDHLFRSGETVKKQIVIINNSRQPLTGACEWSFKGPGAFVGTAAFSLTTGEQKRLPISFEIPSQAASGSYQLVMLTKFSNGEVQTDSLGLEVLGNAVAARQSGKIALFDPVGETARLLQDLGVVVEPIRNTGDLAAYNTLIVGKSALTVDGAAPDISRVRQGLKVLIFEQSSEVLEKRLGFRVQEYGLRQVYARVPDHPALAGLTARQLQDWRGEATLLPRQLKYESRPRYGPTVEWCGIRVPRLWRCGNRGNVASVLIEKPIVGDFLPIVDGGFSLQYSPLLEHREGDGLILFCQMDVTGRSEHEPAADALARNLLNYVADWKPARHREAAYVGGAEGRQHLEKAGIAFTSYGQGKLNEGNLLIAGPGCGTLLGPDAEKLRDWLIAGGRLLAVGLEQGELDLILPGKIKTKTSEHISAWFEPFSFDAFGAGIAPADLHNRSPQSFSLLIGGADFVGDGVLGQVQTSNIVLFQIPPWRFDDDRPNTKRTHRRLSFAFSRLLANLGVSASPPLLQRFHEPVSISSHEPRYLSGLYMDKPEEWDDPYRHFRW
jgi:beta-galactosidase